MKWAIARINSIESKIKLFTRVLPDDNPKLFKYLSGWSNDKLRINGIESILSIDKTYIVNAEKAFATINSSAFPLMNLAANGKIRTNWMKWMIFHASWAEWLLNNALNNPNMIPIPVAAWAILVNVVYS